MTRDNYKEVYYDQYCKTCKHEKCDSSDEPCYHCLDDPVRLYSHKPVAYEPKKKK